jgi:glycosyltransferase involved in cell wall biosynthesis
MANASQDKIKRHKLFLKSFANTKYKILQLGNTNKKYIKMAKELNVNITWKGWGLRKKLPKLINKCKIGICCSTNYDSCPRVIPEYLACNLPIVTENINFWHKLYVTEKTGIIVNENNIKEGTDKLLKMNLNPINYYNENICMDKAVNSLKELIKDIL